MSVADDIRGGHGSLPWTDADLRAALGLDDAQALEGVTYQGVATDTRTLRPGTLFIALDGEHFDAHEFLGSAADAGARAALVERIPEDAPESLHYYVVPDTLVALGRLANARRRRLGARVVAITGTNGKTTTKEMTRAVLAARYRVHATSGNLNNLVGTPLTVLCAPEDTEALVVEVGTNAPGEIARLRDMVEPDAAIITGVGPGHLEGLGTFEGVLFEKTALIERLPEGGVALVADTPAELPARARMLRPDVRVAGLTERADPALHAADVRLDDDGRASFTWLDREVSLPVRGRHNVSNALLALGLAVEWDIGPAEAIAALARVELPSMRMDVRDIGDMRVIVDCYNANPASVQAAGDLLESMPRGGGRVAVIGSMLELGSGSGALHEQAASEMLARDIDIIVATGEFAPAFHGLEREGVRVIAESDPLRAWEGLKGLLQGDEVLLLKGSRGVALERLLPLLEEAFGVHRRPSAGGNRGRRDDAGDASGGASDRATTDAEG